MGHCAVELAEGDSAFLTPCSRQFTYSRKKLSSNNRAKYQTRWGQVAESRELREHSTQMIRDSRWRGLLAAYRVLNQWEHESISALVTSQLVQWWQRTHSSR
jgi:hypothetical protein